MSKGNLILGTSRGKLGDIVTYRSMGQQMARVRVRNVKNPKTLAQMLQRVILASASKSVAVLEPIINHSYQSVAYGPESRRHAQKEFMKVLRAQAVQAYNSETEGREVGLIPLSAVGSSVAAFPISQGSLLPIDCAMEAAGAGQGVMYLQQMPTEGTGTASAVTLGDFLAAFGADIQTQFTFVFLHAAEVGETQVGGKFYAGQPLFARVNFKADADLTAVLFTTTSETDSRINTALVDAERSNNVDKLIFNIDAQSVTYDDGGSLSVAAGTVIKSKYDGSKWLRSTQYLAVGYPEVGTPSQSVWAWNDYEDIVDSVYTGDIVPEDRYLNKEKN